MVFSALKIKHYLWLVRNNPWIFIPNRNTVNYIRYKLSSSRDTVNLSRHGIVFATLYVTKRCNLNCSFCIVGKSHHDEDIAQYDMNISQCERIMDHKMFSRSLYIMLSGGEPLLNADIFNIIKSLKKQRRIVAMITNGTLLDEKSEELRDANIDSLNISVYNTNIKKLKQVVPRVAKYFNIKLCKLVTKSLLTDMNAVEEAADLAASSGCKGLYLANVLPGPGTQTALDNDIVYNDNKDYAIFKAKLSTKYKKLSIHFFEPLHRNPQRNICKMPWYFGLVDNMGNLGFCCYDCLTNKGNLFDPYKLGEFNRPHWVSVRREIIADDPQTINYCRKCYVANDKWGSRV